MSTVHQLSRAEARRIAVRAQVLTQERPADLLDLVRRLSMVQLEPTKAIAPSADLVAWSRLGSSYSPTELADAIAEQALIDVRGALRPAEDLVLYRAEMAVWPGTGPLKEWQEYLRDWVRSNDACRLDLLERLRADGPLTARELPDTCVQPWRSSGWSNNRNVLRLLDLMLQRGEVAVAGHRGRDRLWDLATRVYPDDPVVPYDQAVTRRNERRLQSLGIARAKGPECPVEPVDAGGAGEAAVVEGLRGEWRVDPAQLVRPFDGRAALLSPFDRLLSDRKRMGELFEFDYILEMYKPVEHRRWGYYALPILVDDQLVGKLDAVAVRDAGELQVNAVHWDVDPAPAVVEAVNAEIDDVARWLDLEFVRLS